MKIDRVAGGHVPQNKVQQASKKPLDTNQTPMVSSELELNVNMAAVEKAQAEMPSLPDVDMAKVEQVRQALAQGQLTLDTKILSQALLQFHTGHESS